MSRPRGAGFSLQGRDFPETFNPNSCCFRHNDLNTKLLRAFGQRSDLLLAIPRFVVFVSFIDVLLTVFDEPVEQTSKLAGHGRDRFGSAQTGAQTAVLRAQVAFAA